MLRCGKVSKIPGHGKQKLCGASGRCYGMTQYKLKRVYAPASPQDGWRVLVDRLWPQGESKVKADLDVWEKQLAPSAELREWFHADRTGRWAEFARRYKAELEANPAFAAFKTEAERHPVVTLLFGSRDTEHNNAVVLYSLLTQ